MLTNMENTAVSPLVSVIMPAYNHERYVAAAVESVLGQTYPGLELIVIDDASQDGTWEVLESFKDPRLRLIRHEVNRGAHATLNEALEMAEGEYVAILNSDDVFHQERLDVMVSHLQARPDLAAAFSYYAFIDAAGHVVQDPATLAADFPDPRAALGDLAHAMDEREIRVLSLLARNYLHSTSNLFCRRSVFDEMGGFSNYRYVHDHDFFLRLCQVYPVNVVEQCLLDYRFHDSNTLAESATASVIETGAMLMNFLLKREVRVLRDPLAPMFRAVFAYLLESLQAYGAEKFMLILALAESNGSHENQDVRAIYPAIFDCQQIATLVSQTISAVRQEEELVWQQAQTTQWWETSRLHAARVTELEAQNTDLEKALSEEHVAQQLVGHELWLAKQEIGQHKLEMGRRKQEIEQVRQQLAHSEWEYSNLLAYYRRTWSFKVRQWAKRLLGMMDRH